MSDEAARGRTLFCLDAGDLMLVVIMVKMAFNDIDDTLATNIADITSLPCAVKSANQTPCHCCAMMINNDYRAGARLARRKYENRELF